MTSAAAPTQLDDGAPPRAALRQSWRQAFTAGFAVWSAAQLLYVGVTLYWMTSSGGESTLSAALNAWFHWDSGHYVTIASRGYNPSTENPAFFPLYPMVMRGLDPVLPGGMLATGLIVASISCLAALTLIYRLTDDLFGAPVARRTTLLLMSFPFAFFLCAPYNESLFIALSTASLYCMRRGYWWSAGIWAGLASGTRQAGVLLAVAFILEYQRQRDWKLSRLRWDVAALALVPTGLVGFMIYSWYDLGDPLKFLHVQSYWGRTTTWPWTGSLRAAQEIFDPPPAGGWDAIVSLNVVDLMTVMITVALLLLAVVGPWRLGRESWYLVAGATTSFIALLISPLGDGLPPLQGTPRYVLELLPAFIVLARMLADERVKWFYVASLIVAQCALLLDFLPGQWLA